MGIKRDFIENHWLCTKCGYVNEMYKPDRKRKEVQKNCHRCGKKMTPRAL